MGSKIAADTPKKILDLLQKVDVKKIDKTKLKTWLDVARTHIGSHVPIRKIPASQFVEISENLPSDIVKMFNDYDFNSINAFKKIVAETWIKSNLPMKLK